MVYYSEENVAFHILIKIIGVEQPMADRFQKAVNSNCNISLSELVIIGTVVMKKMMMVIMIVSFMF
jgi:hypothetical protein